jgi:hypothetical protein
MLELKLFYATVISNDDEDKKNKIQVRVLPEFQGMAETYLPWAKPFLNAGMSESNFSKNTPKEGSKCWVVADKYFEEVYYLTGTFIEGFFDYGAIKDSVDAIDEASDTEYPNLNFILLDDGGTILFNNADNSDTGILHSSGSYLFIKTGGSLYFYNGTTKGKIEDNTITFEGSATFDLEGDTFNLGGSTKSLVTFTELNSALQNFMTSLNTHTHPTPSGPSSAPTAPMSLDISSSESQKVKTE